MPNTCGGVGGGWGWGGVWGGGGGGVERTIKVPISTEGSGTPTMRPNTGYPVSGARSSL